jgi:hypothetical protein
VTAAAWALRGSLPGPEELRSEVLRAPRQTATRRAGFTFAYEGETYEVAPRAEYELWGLVVSHNDPTGVWDMYHDASSVDTRDLCVIFGQNAARADYQEVDFTSGAWTCFYEYPGGVRFSSEAIANNHLITSDDAVRARIGSIHVGDQVRLRGLLVDYRGGKSPDSWRRTSTTRRDSEQGACEVVFVEEIDVLARATPGWYVAYDVGRWAILLLLLARLGLLVAASWL